MSYKLWKRVIDLVKFFITGIHFITNKWILIFHLPSELHIVDYDKYFFDQLMDFFQIMKIVTVEARCS